MGSCLLVCSKAVTQLSLSLINYTALCCKEACLRGTTRARTYFNVSVRKEEIFACFIYYVLNSQSRRLWV